LVDVNPLKGVYRLPHGSKTLQPIMSIHTILTERASRRAYVGPRVAYL